MCIIHGKTDTVYVSWLDLKADLRTMTMNDNSKHWYMCIHWQIWRDLTFIVSKVVGSGYMCICTILYSYDVPVNSMGTRQG